MPSTLCTGLITGSHLKLRCVLERSKLQLHPFWMLGHPHSAPPPCPGCSHCFPGIESPLLPSGPPPLLGGCLDPLHLLLPPRSSPSTKGQQPSLKGLFPLQAISLQLLWLVDIGTIPISKRINRIPDLGVFAIMSEGKLRGDWFRECIHEFFPSKRYCVPTPLRTCRLWKWILN